MEKVILGQLVLTGFSAALVLALWLGAVELLESNLAGLVVFLYVLVATIAMTDCRYRPNASEHHESSRHNL